MRESRIQRDIRLVLGQQRDLVVWRNETGAAQQKEGGWVAYGLCKGSADLIGILKPTGRFCAFEVKTPRGRVSKHQKMFLSLVRKMGGFACVVRSVEDAEHALNRAREGASE